jgi:dihydrofolate reductase
MGKVVLDISMSLDGFIAGPNPTLEEPLGAGGERLHEWTVALASWRERHGESGGMRNADDEVVAESLAATGAVVMGRRMFSGGEGAWEDDPNAQGWWGNTPPFHTPVFVVTHHAREPLETEGTTFVFVTDGVESAVEQAREAAGEKNVLIAGGASLAQQVLGAGLLGELQIHLTPVLLGGGTRLLEHVDPSVRLESTRVVESPAVTHLRFEVVTSV